MTKVTYCRDNQKIKQIIFEGHTNQADYGYDIVCASLSTIYLVTINAIIKFGYHENIIYEIADGFSKLEVLKSNQEISILLENLLDNVYSLAKKYPNAIKIMEEKTC